MQYDKENNKIKKFSVYFYYSTKLGHFGTFDNCFQQQFRCRKENQYSTMQYFL